jgi:YNFM family putative membrane transporter
VDGDAVMLAGLLLTLSDALPLIVAGMALFTFGFFASHSVASSWVGRRASGAAGAGLGAVPVLLLPRIERGRLGCAGCGSSGGWPGVVAVLAVTWARRC